MHRSVGVDWIRPILIFITAFALTFGDSRRLVHGVDSFGNVCGYQNTRVYSEITLSGLDLRERRYLFPMDHTDPFNSLWICIAQCPSSPIDNRSELIAYSVNGSVSLCTYDVPIGDISVSTLIPELYPSTSLGPCPFLPILPSKPFRNRCVPINQYGLYGNASVPILEFIEQSDIQQQTAADFWAVYKEILGLCALALGLSGCLVLTIVVCPSFLIYLVTAMAIFGSAALTITLWLAYTEIGSTIVHFEDTVTANGTDRPLLVASARCTQKYLLTFAILSSVSTMFLIGLCSMAVRRSGFMAELFQQAARCLRRNPGLLVQPVFTFLGLIAVFAAWTAAASMLVTADFITAVNHQANWPYTFNITFVDFSSLTPVRYFCWYYVIGLVWTVQLLLASQEFVVASTISSWYFSRSSAPSVWSSLQKLVSYHLGSLAFGSLVIPVLEIPRSTLVWIQERHSRTKIPYLRLILGCFCFCCFRFPVRLILHAHHNAYAVLAMEGTGLYSSAKLASEIVNSKAGSGAHVVATGGTLLFLGKCGVSTITGFIAVLLLKDNPNLQVSARLLLLICVFAYMIAHCFLNSWEMAIDTLMLCNCGKERVYVSNLPNGPEFGDSALNDFMGRICGTPVTPALTAEEIALRSFED